MSPRSFVVTLAALLALSSSCSLKPRETGSSYVWEIIQDKQSRFNRLVAASSHPDPQGEILMIGSERECSILADVFAGIDVRDNVDGSYNPDGLPDFAGETISCIVDTTGRPEKYMLAPDAESDVSMPFRKFILNGFLNALDTVCHVTPYDLDGIGRKRPAKMIICADPLLDLLAGHDVDTLFSVLGSKVHVISPVEEISGAIFNSGAGHDVIAVMDSKLPAGTSLCQKAFMRYAGALAPDGTDVCCFASRDSSGNQLTALLDDYADSGRSRPINVLAVTDARADIQRLKSEYAALLSVLNEDSVRYSQFLSEDFRIIGGVQSTVARCYDLLRSDNLFSHRIARPQIIVYYCHPDPQDNDVSFLVPAPYVQN